MYVAADLANWLEEELKKNDDLIYGTQERARKKQIEEFVDQHPQYFVAAVVWDTVDDINNGVTSLLNGRTFNHMATGFVIDIGKLGTGFADGTAWGIFQDIMRVVSIVPWGRASEMIMPQVFRVAGPVVSRMKQFYWGAIRGKQCAPISIGIALEHTGTKLFITLDDVATAMGRELQSFKGANGVGTTISETRQTLRELKAAFEEIEKGAIRNWSEVESLARNTDGVLLVTVKRTLSGTDRFHQFMVSNTGKGVKIFDRAGTFNTLDDLSRHYGSKSVSEFYQLNTENPLFRVKNWAMDEALISRLNSMGPLGMVVVKGVEMVVGFNPQVGADKVIQNYEQFVAKSQPPAAAQPPAQYVPPRPLKYTHQVLGPVVQKHDWLSSIAQKWYGDMLLWPVLFDHNRDANFTNPNKIKVGQMIQVPDISDRSAAELDQIRLRGRSWR